MYNIVKNNESLQVGKRTIVNLNGTWRVGESLEAEPMISAFDHTTQVPGLLSHAEPAFEKVGDFETRYRQYCKGEKGSIRQVGIGIAQKRK